MKRIISPTTQKILDAWNKKLDPEVTCLTRDPEREALAEAFRTFMVLVVPEHREHHPNTLDEKHRRVSVFNVRNEILSIINELENGE
jgi:hypothetical protein